MVSLSVIIPTYNSEKTIESCINSIVCQKFKDFEICIIDGNSNDETILKICKLRQKNKRIRIISEPDGGVYDAMNKGIDLAQGKWLYFLGSDDEIHDDHVFSDVFNSFIENRCDILYGSVLVNGDTTWAKAGQIYDAYFDIEKLLEKNICHQAIFYQKSLFQRFGKYKTKYLICADWELNLRFFSRAKSFYLDRVIANFYSGGLSSKNIVDPIGNDLEALRRQALRSYRIHRLKSRLRFT